MKYAEVVMRKGVHLIYFENVIGEITIIQRNRVVNMFNTHNLSIDEFMNIKEEVRNIVNKWYFHGAMLRRCLEDVRYRPIN